jgi:iron complex transport system ATP-binding protein
VLIVLHDLNLAVRFADRSLVLHEGRLISAGAGRDRFDLRRLSDAFGVAIAEAVTAGGQRVLVPVIGEATNPRIPD